MKKVMGYMVIVCALVAYGFSLSLPAFKCTSPLPGYQILGMGWLGIIALDPRWYANVAFVILIFAAFRKKIAVISALLGAVLAVFSFAPAAGCGGDPSALGMSTGLGKGGLLWVFAIFMAILGNILMAEPDQSSELSVGAFPDTEIDQKSN